MGKFGNLLMTAFISVLFIGCSNSVAVKSNTDSINDLKAKSDTMSKELHQMSSIVNEMMIQVSIMNSTIDKLTNINMGDDVVVDDEMRFIEQEMSRMDRRLQEMETGASSKHHPTAVATHKKPITVKVLTGTGDIRGAKLLANTLRSTGYNVAVVDYSASDIYQNTVFYAAGFRNEALNLSRILGRDSIVKPLTWDSIFKLIVVKGQ